MREACLLALPMESKGAAGLEGPPCPPPPPPLTLGPPCPPPPLTLGLDSLLSDAPRLVALAERERSLLVQGGVAATGPELD